MRPYKIKVPKDKQAEQDLDYDQATDDQLIEWIMTEKEYYKIDKTGIFELINEKCGTWIDAHEEDGVKGQENLEACIKILENFQTKDPEISQLISKLLELFKEAKNRDTSIWFFF